MAKRTLLVCSLLLLAAGCTTLKAYPGPARSAEETALITGSFVYFWLGLVQTKLLAVDEQPLIEPGQHHHGYARVLPGEHSVLTERCFSWGGKFGVVENCTDPAELYFQADAGHTYKLKSNSDGNIWLVDTNTDEIVARSQSPG